MHRTSFSRRFSAISSLAIIVVCLGCQVETKQEALTAPDLIERCKKAYSALSSYSGKTATKTTMTMSGTDTSYENTAKIQFVRPGKIRVEGTIVNLGSFVFVSDGSRTWTKYDKGDWELVESTERAIAGATGVSGGAATTIPAILIGATWGNPFLPLKEAKVTQETVDGHSTYRVEGSNTLTNTTYWIDSKTYLLVKLKRKYSLGDMAKMMPPEQAKNIPAMRTSGDYEVVETFSSFRTNEAIPDSEFARPKGAP